MEKEDAICDVVSVVFLDKNSQICCENITERCIGITEEQLKKIPNKICVVEGREKYDSVIRRSICPNNFKDRKTGL